MADRAAPRYDARVPDADTILGLRCTVATLQAALTRANERIRELEAIAEKANARAAEAVTMADDAQMALYAAQADSLLPPYPGTL